MKSNKEVNTKTVLDDVELDDMSVSMVEIPKETVINCQFGVKVNGTYEYIDFGNYVVYKVEKQENTLDYKITCYDKMLYSMVNYEDMNITYPITIIKKNNKYLISIKNCYITIVDFCVQ